MIGRRFGIGDAARLVALPQRGDDKYSRGVLGVVTGSDRFPGAAVLGVEGAVRTGVGMVRYLGPERAADLVLRRRPEVVTADGRVQAWLIGSGMPPERTGAEREALVARLRQGLPVVLDAGALDLLPEATGPVVAVPHLGELVTVLATAGVEADRHAIAAEPERWAVRAAAATGATVLLKGATTYVADPGGLRHSVEAGPPWLATAGSGDVLGGVLGALLATHARALGEAPELLADLAAAAAALHGEAGRAAADGAPIAALDIAEALPGVLRRLLADAGPMQGPRIGDGRSPRLRSGADPSEEIS